MKKIIQLIVVFLSFFLPILSFGQEDLSIATSVSNDFTENLRAVGFPIDEIVAQKVISRYDVTRLLNAVECVDCLNPAQTMRDTYIPLFWSNFIAQPGEDFRDIFFEEAFYREGSYYYCVAYAADNEYMNGYPIATSPICSGVFCGAKNTTKAEFLQIIMNVIEKYTFQKYTINRSDVQTRRESLPEGGYADRYMHSLDDEVIAQGVANCGTTDCPLQDRREFKTYRKYCTFELEECDFREYGFLKAGRWPVAEINTLTKEGIINDPNIQETIHDTVDGEFVLATFGNLFPIINCEFDTDYDCDNVDNYLDSCPNTYNPSQRDLDNDGIGNVCDPDIDGDGSTNPIGIVDDNDSIIVSRYDPEMDNCLFTINPEQIDENNNKLGDVCEGREEFVSLWIRPIIDQEKGPLTLGFKAETKGAFSTIERELGDGNIDKGETIVHRFGEPGTYTVIARAKGLRNDAIAKTTIIVGGEAGEAYGIKPTTSKLQGPAPLSATLSHEIAADKNTLLTEMLINEKQDRSLRNNAEYTKNFTENGSYAVSATLKDGDKIVAVTQYNIGVGSDQLGSMLSTESLIYQAETPITLQTTIEGDTSINPIDTIEWEFGDGEKLRSRSLKEEKTYETGGPKVIIQRIIFEDGSIHQNYITVYITDPEGTSSNNQNIALQAEPSYVAGNEETIFTVNEFQINPESIVKKIITFDETITEELGDEETAYIYTQPGVHFPKVSYFTDQCRSLHSQATVIVDKPNTCLEATIAGTLDQFKCDLDEDGIPDICDEDIDGDGNENLVGLILFENDDCSYDDNIDRGLMKEHLEGVCSIDNCPLLSNGDQLDLNGDGLGDVCPELIDFTETELSPSEIDTDGDGYTDDRDTCPLLAENFNNVEDADGCPEIGDNDPCIDVPDVGPFINALNCNSCPCHFADFGGTLQEGDKVRAILTDKPGGRDYTRSFPKIIE